MNNAIFSPGTVIGSLFQDIAHLSWVQRRDSSHRRLGADATGNAIQASKTGPTHRRLPSGPVAGKYGSQPAVNGSANRALRLSQAQCKAAVMRITTNFNLAPRLGNL